MKKLFSIFVLSCFLFQNISFADDEFSDVRLKKINLNKVSQKIEKLEFLSETTLSGNLVTGYILETKEVPVAMSYSFSTNFIDVTLKNKWEIKILPFEVTINIPLPATGDYYIENLRAGLIKTVFSPTGISGQILTYIKNTYKDKTSFDGIEFLSLNYEKVVDLSTEKNINLTFTVTADVGYGIMHTPTTSENSTSEKSENMTTGLSGSIAINISEKIIFTLTGSSSFYFPTNSISTNDKQNKGIQTEMYNSLGLSAKYLLTDWLSLLFNIEGYAVFHRLESIYGYIGFEITF